MNDALNRPDFHLRIVKEINELLNSSAETGSILEAVVQHLARTLGYDIVSIYLWQPKAGILTMSANYGFSPEAARKVSLHPDEGLTGLVFQEQKPLTVVPASAHPRYKYFPELGEQHYETYIGVPIILKRNCLGVLVVQAKDAREHSANCEALLEIIAGRIAGLVEVGERLDRQQLRGVQSEAVRQGVGVASGIAMGPAHKLEGLSKNLRAETLTADTPETEWARLERALAAVDQESAEMIQSLLTESKLSESELGIFRAQRQLLADPVFQENLKKRVREAHGPAEEAVQNVVDALCHQFAALGHAFFRERLHDLRDIEDKLLRYLLQERGMAVRPPEPEPGSILVAHEVLPTHLIAFGDLIRGVVSEVGGEGGHMAILSRSLGIPAVTGIDGLLGLVDNGDQLLVDGRTGFLFVNPAEALVKDYDHYRRKQEAIKAYVRDGGQDLEGAEVSVHVSANIGFPGDLRSAVQAGLSEVGLFRSEFSFMQSVSWPTIQQQADWLREIAQVISGPITVRTLDIGSDKQLPYFAMPREENPMLGLRSIRFSMENTRHLNDQIEAVLRVCAEGIPVRLMLPMVTQLWEMDAVRQIVDSKAEELKIPAARKPPLGMMVEVPGIYWVLDDFLARADFVSVGTNDLVQYLLAVDRNSAHVGHLYCEHHPIVIRFLHDLLKRVSEVGKPVTVCGEMAGNPSGILILLALGYAHFSVLPQRAPVVRFIGKRISREALSRIRSEILQQNNPFAIQAFLNRELRAIHPDLLSVD